MLAEAGEEATGPDLTPDLRLGLGLGWRLGAGAVEAAGFLRGAGASAVGGEDVGPPPRDVAAASSAWMSRRLLRPPCPVGRAHAPVAAAATPLPRPPPPGRFPDLVGASHPPPTPSLGALPFTTAAARRASSA